MINSLKSKLITVTVLLVAVTCIQLVTMMFKSGQIEQNALATRDNSSVIIGKSYQLKLAVVQVQQWLTDISATRGLDGLNDGFDQAAEHYTRANQLLSELGKLNQAHSDLYTIMSRDIIIYYETGKRMANAYVKHGPQEGNKLMAEFDEAAAKIQAEVEEAMQVAINVSNLALTESVTLASDLKRWIIVTSAMLLLIILGSGIFMVSSVIRPICTTARLARQLASGDGDLTLRLDGNRRDEIGEVARNVNEFISKVHDALKRTAQMTAVLGDSSNKVTSAAYSTDDSMRALRDNSQSVAVAAKEMGTTAEEIAKSANQVAISAEQADSIAKEGKSVVSQAIQSITSFAEEFSDAATNISKLRAETDNIGSILDVIRGIADQTNLLALNAAIEAARAGEQGRGFAVVADEVRTLAYRSQESTNEIQELIERLQKQAETAATMIESGHVRVTDAVTQAEHAGTALTQIVDSIGTITGMTVYIATSSEEQSSVIEQINHNISTVDELATETVHHADTTTGVSSELSQALASVTREMQNFRFDDDEQIVLQQAKTAHLAWKSRLRDFLDGKGHISKDKVVSDHECDLGNWFYSKGMEQFGEVPEFQAIEQPHKQIHELIKRVITLQESGDTASAESVFEEVSTLSELIVPRIEALAIAMR